MKTTPRGGQRRGGGGSGQKSPSESPSPPLAFPLCHLCVLARGGRGAMTTSVSLPPPPERHSESTRSPFPPSERFRKRKEKERESPPPHGRVAAEAITKHGKGAPAAFRMQNGQKDRHTRKGDPAVG